MFCFVFQCLFLQKTTTTQEPWKWSTEVVQVCWCMNNGITQYSTVFSGIDGKKLLEEVDVKWMKERGIPNGSARIAFEDIEHLREIASKRCILM